MHFSRKFFVLIAIFTLINFTFISFIMPVKEVQALAPLALAPEIITVVAGLATAAGITFIDNDAAKAWVSKAWGGFKETTKSAVNNVITAGAVAGVYSVFLTKALWSDLTNSASTLEDGEVILLDNGVLTDIEITGLYQQDVILNNGYGTLNLNITLANNATYYVYATGSTSIIVTRQRTVVGGVVMDVIKYILKIGTVYDSGYKILRKGSECNSPLLLQLYSSKNDFDLSFDNVSVYNSQKHSLGLTKVTFVAEQYGQCVFYPLTPYFLEQGTSYVINNHYVNNPAWDLSNKTLALPDSLDNVVGKSVTDIVNENTISDGISAPGAAIDTLVGKVGVIEDSLTSTNIAPALDFSPLITVADLFSNKFPFSLPWDFAHSFSFIATENSWTPVFSIDVSEHIPGFAFDIDLHLFDSILPYVRSFEIFLFDLGLVLATSRLLGGDA